MTATLITQRVRADAATPDRLRQLIFYCDGLTEPINPGGYACWAWVALDDEGAEISSDYGCLGYGPGFTNNLAEYAAVEEALKWAGLHHAQAKIVIRTDSLLVVNQVNGRWHCRAPHLQPLQLRCARLLGRLQATLEWVPRERNERADALTRVAYREARARKEPR